VYKKILTVLLLTGIVFSQQKVGIVFMEKLRLDYEGFKDAQQQLQLELEVIQKEYQSMATKLDSMMKEYDQQSLMMSDELKKAKEQDIRDMDTSMQSYQLSKVGPQGEFTRKQQQLEFDLMNQIKEAVDKVAIDGGFDLILDGSSSSLYTKPTLNITDSVLTELRS
jgi:outer membrane protein